MREALSTTVDSIDRIPLSDARCSNHTDTLAAPITTQRSGKVSLGLLMTLVSSACVVMSYFAHTASRAREVRAFSEAASSNLGEAATVFLSGADSPLVDYFSEDLAFLTEDVLFFPPEVTDLRVDGSEGVSDASLQAVPFSLARHIGTLRFDNCDLTNGTFSALSELESIDNLLIFGGTIDSRALSLLSSVKIGTISFADTNFETGDLEHLARFKELTKIYLLNVDIRESDLPTLSEVCTSLPKLRVLIFSPPQRLSEDEIRSYFPELRGLRMPDKDMNSLSLFFRDL